MDSLSNANNNIHAQHQSLIHSHLPLDIISEICLQLFPKGMTHFVTVCRLWNRIGLQYVWDVKITPLRFFVNHITCHTVMDKYPKEKKELSILVSEEETPPSSLKLISCATPIKVMAASKQLVRLSSDEFISIKSAENGLVVQDKMNVLALAETLIELEKANLMAEGEERDAILDKVALSLTSLRFLHEAFDVIRSMSSGDKKIKAISAIKVAFNTTEHFIEACKIIVKIGNKDTQDHGFIMMAVFLIRKKLFYIALLPIRLIPTEESRGEILKALVDVQDKKELCGKVLDAAKSIKDSKVQSGCLWYIGMKWREMKFFAEAKLAAQVISDEKKKGSLEDSILIGLIDDKQAAEAIDYLDNWPGKDKKALLLLLVKALIENELFKEAQEFAKSRLKVEDQATAFIMIVTSLIEKKRLDEALKVAYSIPDEPLQNHFVNQVLELKRSEEGSFCSVM